LLRKFCKFLIVRFNSVLLVICVCYQYFVIEQSAARMSVIGSVVIALLPVEITIQ